MMFDHRYVFAPARTSVPNSARSQYENTKTMIINDAESVKSNIEGIPPEVNRIIEQDLAKNPVVAGAERMYRIVINSPNPNEDAQVVRVLVKNESARVATATIATVNAAPQSVIYASQTPSTILVQQHPTNQYTLPPVEQTQYTPPPPHRTIILPRASDNTPEKESEIETKKKPKKRFGFFS